MHLLSMILSPTSDTRKLQSVTESVISRKQSGLALYTRFCAHNVVVHANCVVCSVATPPAADARDLCNHAVRRPLGMGYADA